jgi:hypothetical protein
MRPKHCAAEFWKLGTPQKNCSDEEQIRVDVASGMIEFL